MRESNRRLRGRAPLLFLAALCLSSGGLCQESDGPRENPRPRTSKATLSGNITDIVPMSDGEHIVIKAAMSCRYLTIDDVLGAAPATSDAQDPLGRGYSCACVTTDGDDEILTANSGSLLLSNPKETGADLLGGSLLQLRPASSETPAKSFQRAFQEARSMRMAPDGRALAVGNSAGQIYVVVLPGGEYHELDKLESPVQDLRFTNEGGLLLALDHAGRVSAWDWQTERASALPLDPRKRTSAIATATKTPVFARWADGAVEVYAVEDWTKAVSFPAEAGAVAAFDIDPAGRWLAFAGENTAAVVDLATRRLAGHLPFQPRAIRAMAVTPDGRLLIVGTSDGKISTVPLPGGLLKQPWVPTADDARAKGLSSGGKKPSETAAMGLVPLTAPTPSKQAPVLSPAKVAPVASTGPSALVAPAAPRQ